MRYLEGQELEEAGKYIDGALEEAGKSRCHKSQHGVIIIKDGKIIGRGSNNPPAEMPCVPEVCYSICREYAVHAEQNAIIDALRHGHSLDGSRMYHMKIKDGKKAAVKTPEEKPCLQCGKLILESGISEFVLHHEGGFAVYSSEEHFSLSL